MAPCASGAAYRSLEPAHSQREWVQGLQNFFWSQKEVQDELQKIMEKSFDEVNA